MDTAELRRTPLYDRHVALHARMVPFAGFAMPVQYAGVLREHEAVRRRAGLFDLSHMGQIALRGPDVGAWADTLSVNHVATMRPGQARYNLFCNEHGGTHDDVIFYRLSDEEWLLVVNASNAHKMWALLKDHERGKVELENRHGRAALIAIQGPRAADVLLGLVAAADRERARALRYYACAQASVAGTPLLLARTGYTGEDGFELFVAGEKAGALWDALLEAGASAGLEPCGLGARDVLRLEAGMPLYGHELEEEITPLQAGLDRVVKFDKPRFVGKAALEEQRAQGGYPRVAGFVLDGRAPPPRPGYRVYAGGDDVGEVCSGAPGPSVGNRSIGTALVEAPAAAPGTALAVEVRDKRWPATVVELPFYRRPRV
jgi:aminomethyltransferase